MSFFPFLGSSFRIGSLDLKNRIVMPAMGTRYADEGGFITDRQIAYYAERARGGAGLIITEHVGIAENGRAHDNMVMLSSDEYIPGFRNLIAAVHGAGGKIAVQLNHCGRQRILSTRDDPLVAPSPIPSLESGRIPRALSPEEISGLAEGWAKAAARARTSGADGIEIHMAHGYLLNQFLSPLSNRREDSYGGSLEGRLKFPLEVLRAVRQKVGPDFPVWCRLSGCEFVEGGIELEATKKIAPALEKEGAQALHISAGLAHGSIHMVHPCYYAEDGPYVSMAAAVKSIVKIPVIAVGKIKDPAHADRILKENRCDLVAMGRALIADPYLPEKSFAGRWEDIRPCISCNRCSKCLRESSLKCTVNPRVGREIDAGFKVSPRPKKILIIGGGVAGLTAAETGLKCGHRVTVVEKKQALGGQVNRGMIPPGKAILGSFVKYLERQVRKGGGKIELGIEADADLVQERDPDIVVIATGARPFIPDLAGREKVKLLTFEDVLQPEPLGGKRILVLGGGSVGAEIADYLASQGKEVTLVEMREEIAYDSVAHLRHYLLERLGNQKVEILTRTKVVAFDAGSVIVEDPRGTRKLRGYDHLVVAMGSKSSPLADSQLRGKVEKILVIGDARIPGEIINAVQAGYDLSSQML